ncbi:Fic family protein [Candidatus Parcubacteria bacterium]|nr:Fic family protein [Candidatus Parcubacteria bacterium]
MKISVKLQFIKKISGLTQENLAKKLEVSFVTLNSWINNKSIPHKKKQGKIDELYKRYTGESIISDSEIAVKKNMLLRKNKSNKNLVKTIANREDIFNEFVLQLTYNSNSIEGSTLTENDTEAILFRNESIKNRSLIEHLEAKNHQAAMKYLFKQVQAKMKISEELILKLHSVLMNGIRDDAGMYRKHGVRIVGANVPTANYIKVPELMKNLVSGINGKNNDLLNHITKIHSRFEQIHPFSDGNGRIGRLIMLIMLLGNNFAPAIIKQENKNLYYRYLRKSQIHKYYSLLEDFICDAVFEGYKIIEE